MDAKTIDPVYLKKISSHYRSQGMYYAIKSLNYERCAELPYILKKLEPRFKEKLNYLDIGSGGESPLPTFLLKNTNWNIYCIDKFDWVNKQIDFAKKNVPEDVIRERLHIIKQDFLVEEFNDLKFDVITNVSVIEHFDGTTDSTAMNKSARLLKAGGTYILTTLFNEGHFKELYVNNNVYGVEYKDAGVFYQRHYDSKSISDRLIVPSGLKEKERIYFGDYGFRFFERFLQLPKLLKPLKVLYSWAVPFFAKKYITYNNKPISYADMKINTSSGIILTLTN
ncbi:MAG TPA: methyltransferase domain-containing protein [Chitinophagaceae bacterium]|nr:methyltransferase domain-containing protein [Chitinophagaceae bacterium]